MRHLKEFIKILAALIASFILVMILSKTIFFPATPRINLNFIANLFKKSPATIPTVSDMTPIAPGVYAKEDIKVKTVYLRYTKDVQWEEKVINYNGQKITILSPK